MRGWIAAAMTVLLGGCAGGLSAPAEVPLSLPPGTPAKARVMVHIAQSDLERKFSYQLNSISRQETNFSEGAAMDQAARALLGRGFTSVATNQPSPLPDVVARVSGSINYDRTNNTYKVSCVLTAVRADGIPIGTYYDAYKSPPMMSIEDALPRVYAQCLKGPVESLMRSADLQQLEKAGFPPLDRQAVTGYLRSQGFLVR